MERKIVRKSNPREVQRRANTAIKTVMPQLFSSFSSVLPVVKQAVAPSVPRKLNPDDQEPVDAALKASQPQTFEPPKAEPVDPNLGPAPIKPPQADTPKMEEPKRVEAKGSDTERAPKPENTASKVVDQLNRADAYMAGKEAKQASIRPKAQTRTQKPAREAYKQSAQKASVKQQKPKQQRPAGQGKGPPQFFGDMKFPKDPSVSVDFSDLTEQDQSVMTYEDMAETSSTFNESMTGVMERLLGHVAGLSTRVRILEDTLDRMRVG